MAFHLNHYFACFLHMILAVIALSTGLLDLRTSSKALGELFYFPSFFGYFLSLT